jgi:arylformamidase
MRTIDLSHILNNETPFYPGTPKPEIRDLYTVRDHGFAEKTLNILTHTGTHMDAPAHILDGHKTLDDFSIACFHGKGVVIDCRGAATIGENLIAAHKDQIAASDFILFHTGWDAKWGHPDYYINYPTLSLDAVDMLLEYSIKGLGFDTISIDKVEDTHLPNHKPVLAKEIFIIENLANLDALIDITFEFYCLPLKIENADGSPIRAIAIIRD